MVQEKYPQSRILNLNKILTHTVFLTDDPECMCARKTRLILAPSKCYQMVEMGVVAGGRLIAVTLDEYIIA